jgi:hypothetical protein
MDTFINAAGPCGFRREALLGVYGLAEATLGVSSPPTLNPPPPVLVARRATRPETPVAGPAEPARILQVSEPAEPGTDGFPDLRGMSAREAVRALARLGLTARMHGTGVVIEQRPEPGAVIDGRTACELWLDRRSPEATREAPARVANGTHP